MQNDNIIKRRKDFFEKIMNIVDEAEGDKDTTYGPFSFLWENSYVRDAVVSSFDTKTSITGLKIFLAMNVFEMHTKENKSKISYGQIVDIVQGTSTKQYSIDFTVLDICADVKKNKEALREKLYSMYPPEKVKNSVKYLEESEELFPCIFMDKLRSVVWSKLRDFFKLSEQNVCSECSKKSMVYFQFIQAVALFEIFYRCLIDERAADAIEKEKLMLNEIGEEMNQIKELTAGLDKSSGSLENILEIQRTIQKFNDKLEKEIMDELFSNNCHLEIYQALVMEFGISLNAMCYLLMIFEAMQVCDFKMRGLKHLSLEIKKNLRKIYDTDLTILEKTNHKRAKRYRQVNERIEELLEYRYAQVRKNYKELYKENEEYEEEDAIYLFMVELCKPVKEQNKELLRGLEGVLGCPIYYEQKIKNSVIRQ